MDTTKVGGGILAAIIVFGAMVLLRGFDSEKSRYEQLKVGMSAKEVQMIVAPRSRRPSSRSTIFNNISDDTLHINDVMVLTFRSGRLAHKQWVGKTDKASR